MRSTAVTDGSPERRPRDCTLPWPALWLVAAVLAVTAGGRRPRHPARRAADGPGDLGRPERRPACEGLAVRLDAVHRHPLRRDSSSSRSPVPPNRPSAGAGPSARCCSSSPSAWSPPAPCPSRSAAAPALLAAPVADQPADAVAARPQHPLPRPDQHHPGPAGPARLLRRPRASGPAACSSASPPPSSPRVLLFAPLLWFTGRRRAAAHHRRHLRRLHRARLGRDAARLLHATGSTTSRAPASAAAADDLANQSLHGAAAAARPDRPAGDRALPGRSARPSPSWPCAGPCATPDDGQLLLAVAITGCAAIAVSPTAWQHQLLWVLLAVVGRVGTRAARPATCGRSPSSWS